jgi:hypothetical protein
MRLELERRTSIRNRQVEGEIKMKTRIFKVLVAAMAAAFGGLYSAKAIPTVMFSADQGATWVTLSSPTTFVGSWRINATEFSTAGLSGQAPALGFNSFDATSRLPGILMVRLYDTGFQWGDPTSYYLSQVDGSVVGGSRLMVNTYVNAANNPFNSAAISGDLLTAQGGFFAGALNSDAANTTYGIPPGPFSMMFEATISQRVGGGSVAFSSSLIDTPTNGVPDGGATLLLLGLGLASLVLIPRARMVFQLPHPAE